jgi:hypothetical protein
VTSTAAAATELAAAPPPVAAAAPLIPAAAAVEGLPAGAAPVGLPFIPQAAVVPGTNGVEGLLLPAAATAPGSAQQLNLSTLTNLPAFPQLLPQQLGMPHDLICAGTAWPAQVANMAIPTLPNMPNLPFLPAVRPGG